MNIQDLEYRMYGMVPYNLSPIQQGIQFGHAVQEYNNNYFIADNLTGGIFNQWRLKDKTFIILGGGTTNDDIEKLGTLNKHHNSVVAQGIPTGEFYEPDLGDQLTAFIVDERVFNKEKYPDYQPLSIDGPDTFKNLLMNPHALKVQSYEEWVDRVGGERNVFLREFLLQFRLA